jgi:MFS family permease
MTATSAVEGTADRLSPEARRSVVGGVASLLVDSYDIYLPAFVLPATAYFEPPSTSPSVKATLVTVIFTVTLLARPIGGPLFGNLGDKIGRKRVTMLTGTGFTVVTLLIACLPGYQQWGVGSITALIVLRLVGGVFLGGGYAGPVPLAIERAPHRMRGLVGGLVSAGAPVAVIFISVVQLVMLKGLSTEAFTTWGWRLPFFFGALLGVAYLVYYSRVPEVDTERLESARKSSKTPLLELLSRRHIGNLVQAFLLMTGMWLAAQMMLSFLPSLLIGVLHQSKSGVSTMEIVGNVLTLGGMIGFAALSQRIGRRPMLLMCSASITVGASLAFVFMVRLASSGAAFLAVATMAVIAFFLANAPLGCVVVYLNERFGFGIRSSGYGTAYTVSLIIPALYSVWISGLRLVMPFQYTALVLIVLGGALFFAAAYFGPETRDTDLRAEIPGSPAATGMVPVPAEDA